VAWGGPFDRQTDPVESPRGAARAPLERARGGPAAQTRLCSCVHPNPLAPAPPLPPSQAGVFWKTRRAPIARPRRTSTARQSSGRSSLAVRSASAPFPARSTPSRTQRAGCSQRPRSASAIETYPGRRNEILGPGHDFDMYVMSSAAATTLGGLPHRRRPGVPPGARGRRGTVAVARAVPPADGDVEGGIDAKLGFGIGGERSFPGRGGNPAGARGLPRTSVLAHAPPGEKLRAEPRFMGVFSAEWSSHGRGTATVARARAPRRSQLKTTPCLWVGAMAAAMGAIGAAWGAMSPESGASGVMSGPAPPSGVYMRRGCSRGCAPAQRPRQGGAGSRDPPGAPVGGRGDLDRHPSRTRKI